MRETEYTYAVARIRANELSLLTANDIEQLITAVDTDTSMRILADKGWTGNDETELCENELSKTWNLISECVPDSSLLEALIIGNDFSNLKAAIKTTFAGIDSEQYMTIPCVTPSKTIIEAVKERNFDILPEHLKECGEKAYKAISDGGNGQDAEIIIDRCCLDIKAASAVKSESDILKKIVKLNVVISNVKTAIRSVRTGKTKEFALAALSSGCNELDNERLVEAAFAGENLADIVSQAGIPEIAEYVDGDFSALETAADNLMVSYTKKAKYDIFGADAVVAYYYAKFAEIKNVRIILSAKASGVPKESIEERVRDLYA